MVFNCAKVLCAVLACCLIACRAEVKPPSFEEIESQRMALPALFITTSGKHIQAPGNVGVFVDKASREIAWPAYACNNPECPGRKPDGKPPLFTWPDPRFVVTPEGTLGTRDFTTNEDWLNAVESSGGHSQPTCPECLKIRNLTSETAKQREQFAQFVSRYELPEAIARRAELDAQWQARKAYLEQRTRPQ